MKNLIVYYSHDGNTRYIEKLIAERIDADVLELKPKKEFPKEGFKKYFWGGKSAVFNEKPVLLNTLPVLDEYDTIIIGTPIWASTYAPPVNTFISSSHISK